MDFKKEIEKIISSKVIEKKEYSNLNTEFIKKIINKNINENFKKIENEIIKLNKKNNNLKKENNIEEKNKISNLKELKNLVKIIRSEIGERYGQFLTSKYNKKQNKILNEINSLNEEIILELLKLHKSTRERCDYYEKIYSKIFDNYKTNNLLDIACGLNPISIYFIEKKQNKKINNYIGIDLNKNDMKFINEFYKKFNFNGEFFDHDITELNWIEKIKEKKIDTIFLLKAIDSFEKEKKNISKEILNELIKIRTIKKIIVSFPTKSIKSKENFNKNKRNWFFKFLEEKKIKFEIFEIENELFIIINL
jgi:hypothetical protein